MINAPAFLRLSLVPALLFASVLFSPGATGVRFGLVTDVHYADREPAGTRFYRQSAAKLAEFVNVMNREKPDFIVELGDFKDQDTPPDRVRTLKYLDSAEAVFGRFRGLRFHVLGNHDQDSISKAEFLERAPNSGIKRTRSYYSADVKGVHFVFLDANYRADGSDYDRGNFDWTDANIPQHELEWLRKDLGAARAPVIVFVHQQLDGAGSYYVRNAPAVRELLESSGRVRAVFQGHRHEGAYSRINGIHYVTLKGLIEGPDPDDNAYALATVDGSGVIHIAGYRKEENRVLGF